MLLHARRFGEGFPLVLLHGLFGAGDNWWSVGRALVAAGLPVEIIALDLRNHGRSPHASDMGYPAMAADVRETLQALGLSSCHLLGHSMGGKVALQIACNPDHAPAIHLQSLIVVDIAPRQYQPSHHTILEAMNSLDVKNIVNQQQASAAMESLIPDAQLRLFLLKNLRRDGDGGYRWQLNLETLTEQYAEVLKAPEFGRAGTSPATLIRGGLEPDQYVNDDDLELFRQWCPLVEIQTLTDAGHWPHASHPHEVTDILHRFLGAHTP